MKKLLRVTPGKNHAVYETDKGTTVRKPNGQEVKASYWDAKSVIAVTIFIILGLAIWAPHVWFWKDDIKSALSAVTAKEKRITLDIEVTKSGGVLYQTDDTIAILLSEDGSAQYKINRAAYGDDCFYNLAGRSTYGSGEDVISVNGSYEYTYKISCQPLIGRGEITSVAKTVIVLVPAEISSAEVVLQSQ